MASILGATVGVEALASYGVGALAPGMSSVVACVILCASGALTAAATAYFGLRRIEARLAAISRVVDLARDGDYDERAEVGHHDYIGELAHSVNGLVEFAADREQHLVTSALYDPLTGLANRTLLTDRIRQTIALSERHRQPFSIAVLDMDRFKFVNDSLGHSVGDTLLREVARRLKQAVRESDTVARLGGDEFVLLLAGDRSAAEQVAERVLEAARDPMQHNGHHIDINLSIGIAVYPEHGQDDLTLLRNADTAMYRAKRQQLGKITFDGDAHELRRSYLSMHGELRAALEAGQFELDFQPKLDLHSGLIVGVEGLVRWNHPTRGRIPPGEFIPFAEQSGFMREISRWVIGAGARAAAQLEKMNLDVKVAVNVSALDIQRPDFSRLVAEVIQQVGVRPDRLCLEITESGVVSESDNALRNLKQISALGVRLAVDDFGTGYATLTQLQQLPVNELKIDRSFVSGMHQNRGNQTIVRSTVDLAKQLGLKVVAEGVETVHELRLLARIGCDQVQGYYVAKPMPADELAGWVEMRHALHTSSREDYFKMLATG
ncbi:MAG: EAL domain-containing protein [Burkholderiaceae bacterium]